jgi:hypothetical protein
VDKIVENTLETVTEELHRLTKGIGIVYLFRYPQRKGKK